MLKIQKYENGICFEDENREVLIERSRVHSYLLHIYFVNEIIEIYVNTVTETLRILSIYFGDLRLADVGSVAYRILYKLKYNND